MKVCSKCKIEKDECEFNKDRTTKDGYQHVCKQCQHEYRIAYYNKNKREISARKSAKMYLTYDHFNGTLNPNSERGKGVISEHVVYEVLGDCIKYNTVYNFGAPYDLLSEKYGTIDVKSSSLHIRLVKGKLKHYKNYYRRLWHFSKSKHDIVPDYFICVGFNTDRTKIERVWIIPSTSKLVTKCIEITNSDTCLLKAKEYEVDAEPYDNIYQNLDIYSLPEFRNLNSNTAHINDIEQSDSVY